MLLYLLRHAHAVDHANDAARALSPTGHREVDALAAFLKKNGAFRPEEVWHSPLVRARETATRLLSGLALTTKMVERKGLIPDAHPSEIVRELSHGPEALALVGHEPHMTALASLLITGEFSHPVFVFEKCALVALEGAGQYWAVRWHLSPQLLTTR